jgi:ribosomal protein S18 acetylase RimI-like enzyme
MIRTARADDAETIVALWQAAGAEPSVTDDVASVRALIARDPHALLVAHEGTQIVGTLIAGWDGWRASFYRLAVLPDHRRRGMGRALVEHAERRLARLGARRITLILVTSDPAAFAFWQAVGYVVQDDRSRLVKNL